MTSPYTYSSVDVGSNAIRQIIIEAKPGESNGYRWKILKKFRAPLRLGTDVFRTNKLSPETIQLLVEIFQKIAVLNLKFKVKKSFISATSALRDCENKKEVLATILKKTKQKINIISGDQEAMFIREAVTKTHLIHFKNILMIDIGGGSIELSILDNLKLVKAESMPLGVVRLLQQKTDSDFNWKKQTYHYLNKFKKNLKIKKLDFAVGTGGNFDALSKLKIQLLKKLPDTNISMSEIVQILAKWKKMTLPQKLMLDIRKDRIDVLDIALPLIILIMKEFDIDRLKIPQTGLKEGVILNQILRL